MKSLPVGEMFSRTTASVAFDKDAVLSNLKSLLMTEVGDFELDPMYGTHLRHFTFDQNDSVLSDLVVDDIYTAVAAYMPQLLVRRDGIAISRERGKLVIRITAMNRLDYTTSLYTVVYEQAAAAASV